MHVPQDKKDLVGTHPSFPLRHTRSSFFFLSSSEQRNSVSPSAVPSQDRRILFRAFLFAIASLFTCQSLLTGPTRNHFQDRTRSKRNGENCLVLWIRCPGILSMTKCQISFRRGI